MTPIAASPATIDHREPERRALRQALFDRVRSYAIPFRIRESEQGLLAAFEMGQVCRQVQVEALHDPEVRWDLFCAEQLGYGYVQIRKFADIAAAFQRGWIEEAPQGRLIEVAAVIARGGAALPEDIRLLLWEAAQGRCGKTEMERVRAAAVSHLRVRPQATKDEVRALLDEVRGRGPDADELLKEGRRALARVDKIRRQMAAAGFADAMALLEGPMGLGLSPPVPDPPPGPDRRAMAREVAVEVEPISVTETPEPPPSPPSEAPPAAAQPPRRRGPDEHFLPVPSLQGNDHPTEAERHAASLVILLFHINRLIPKLLRLWDERQPMAHTLQYRSIRILLDFLDIREAIAPCAKRGAAEPGDNQLPVCTADDPPRPLLYLTLQVVDPEGDPDPTESERMLWILLGLVACCRRVLFQYGERFVAGDAIDPLLQHQLAAALWDNVAPVGMMITNLRKGAVLGQAESEAADAAAEKRQQEAAAHTVIGGTDRPSGAWTVVGMTALGHYVAVDKATGQVLILVGTPGTGKTQFGVNLAEGLVLSPEGLSSGDRSGCVFVFTTDFRRGAGNHQHFCGLSQNPYADQRRYLREYYGVREVHNAAYERVIAYVQPGTLAAYQARYPDLCERGLEFREIFFHPSEQGSFFYKLMLPGGEQSGKGRSQWRMHIDNCIAHRGLGGDPALLLQDFLRARLTGANQAAVQAQFRVIQQMTSTEQRMTSALCEPGFSVFLLESASLGGDILVPMELALINVLSQETKADPYRMFILHEFGKQGTSEQVGPFLKELFGEVRHRPCTYVVETHHIGDLPAGLVPLATGLVHFAGTSQQDFRRVQELFYPYQRVPFSAIAGQERGQGHIAFRVATDRRFTEVAQPFIQRPSLIWAGGETVAR